jgi:signal peptidase I
MGKSAKLVQPGKAIAAAFCIALVMKLFLFDFMIAEGRSMIPAIRSGDLLLVNRAAYGLRLPWTGSYMLRWKLPETGDIVVFKNPLGETAVKRCAAVEERGLFALGDNGPDSLDSRSYGYIQLDSILGKVVGIR